MSGRRLRLNLSERIAAFLTEARAGRIPDDVLAAARLHILDGLAVMLAGAPEPASRAIHRHLRRLGGKGEALVLGTHLSMPCQSAALANGVQGHVLDYDDAQLATSASRPPGQQTHPTSPVLAAALAIAEKHRRTGSDLIKAYVLGVEVACRLGDAVDPAHYRNGFHPTGTLGTFGAAAACGSLLGLDGRQLRHALGIAGSLASGVRANRGTMAKSLSAGRAAENGVLAATLAAQGFTASTDIFDDAMGYVAAACAGGLDPRRLTFGRPFFFRSPGVAIKLYPCPGVLHRILDIVIDLAREHDLDPGHVRSIEVDLPPEDARPLVYDAPRDGLEAKFSLPFAVAVAVIDRAAGLRQFTDRRVRDPRVRRLMTRVKLVQTASPEGVRRREARVQFRLRNGDILCRRARSARGRPENAVSVSEIERKFLECGGRVLPAAVLERFAPSVYALEAVPSVSRWLRSLAVRRN